MNWYKTLDINRRIALKECFILLCGAEWSKIGLIIDLRTRIDLAYEKLKMEGIII